MKRPTCICGYCFPSPPGSLCGGEKDDDMVTEKDVSPLAYISPGTWHRGEEHESKITLYKDDGTLITINIGSSKDAKLLMEYELVENLYLWPHPQAPKSEYEADFPKYRQRAYQKLMSEMREKGYL